eukprot:Skav229954  [mRNA]  locus=scaffold2665:281331:290326:- [translate_table: standard]
MNFVPFIVCTLVPWGMFVLVYSLLAAQGLLSFQIHYSQPILCNISVFVLLVIAIIILVKAMVTGRFKIFAGVAPEREPSWWVFFALTLLLAWIMAFHQGDKNFQLTSKYYDLANLNNYTQRGRRGKPRWMVYPNRMLGQQLLDAGIVQFAPGSQVDVQKSMGSWAPKGTDCCSGSQADFTCRNYNNPQASGGIRLAVQQAEATYNIKAAHPLFFHWEVDPSSQVSSWLMEGHQTFAAWMVSYLVFQLFLVAVAAVVFSKIGHT